MKFPVCKSLLFVGTAVVVMSTQPTVAWAQDAELAQNSDVQSVDNGTPNEIVVTALRKETRLQTTPAAVAAISSNQLKERGISNVQDIALSVPGLSFGTTGGQAHISIRGIGADSTGTGNDPRVAFYRDGVYIGRPTAQLGGMFDIERVEVLKGPQGTLYGRNAMGGAINIISQKPSNELSGSVLLSYGNYNAVNAEVALGGGITEGLSARLAIQESFHDGYGKNLVTGHDIDDKQEFGARFSLLWEPIDNVTFLTIADYTHQDDRANGVHFLSQSNAAVPITGITLGGRAAANSRDIYSDIDPMTDYRIWGINETVTIDLGGAELQSIFAYRETNTAFRTDIDGTETPLAYTNLYENARQISEELQLSGSTGKLDWLVGALYYNEKINDETVAPFSRAVLGGPIPPYQQGYYTEGTLKTEAINPYARLSYHLTDQFTLTASGRYNSEKRSVNDTFQFDFSRPFSPSNPVIPSPGFPRTDKTSFKDFVPSATIEYKASDNIFAYATYSEGFKSGGYNLGVSQPAYRPEQLKNYEIGVKTTWLNGKLIFNVTGFHENYKDLQVSQIKNTLFVIENAASATINGVEVEASAGPFIGFTFDGSMAYLDTKFDVFTSVDPAFPTLGNQDLSGNQLTQAPKLSLHGGVEKVWLLENGQLKLRGDANYVSRNYFTPFNLSQLSQAGYTTATASLSYKSEAGWTVATYIKNIGDVKAVAQSYVSAGLFGAPVLGTFIPPRTYGLRAGYEF